MATRTPTPTGTDAMPMTRAAPHARPNEQAVQATVTSAAASARRALHAPAPSPTTTPAAAARHEASASTTRMTPESLKYPRFTSPHRGVSHRNAAEPAKVSARTNAITPAEPLTPSFAYGRIAYRAAAARLSGRVTKAAGSREACASCATAAPSRAAPGRTEAGHRRGCPQLRP